MLCISHTVDDVARLFHINYELFAPQFGYATRENTCKPWSEVPENNKALMRATVKAVLQDLGIALVTDEATCVISA